MGRLCLYPPPLDEGLDTPLKQVMNITHIVFKGDQLSADDGDSVYAGVTRIRMIDG